MGNINAGKILPVFDTLLLLVTTIFGTAGLLRSVEPDRPDPNSPACDRLMAEVDAKRAEAEELAKKLDGVRRSGDLGLDALQTLLQAASGKQEKLAGIQAIITDARGKLEDAKTVAQDKYNSVTLENAIRDLKRRIEQLERRIQDLQNEVTEEDRKRAEIQELQQKLEAALLEIERLEAQLRNPPDQPTRGGRFGGGYHGPFILLECDGKGVVVYPGSKRMVVGSPVSEMSWLKDEVRRVGAAQLLVRPDGFKESYAKFYGLLTELADVETPTGKKIVLSFWPIEANESIEEYLPENH